MALPVWCLALALVLAACGATTRASAGTPAAGQAAATSTAAAQATRAAQPVTLALQVTQRGTVAANDVQLIATATIANHTTAAIHLSGSACRIDFAQTTGGWRQVATIAVEVDDAAKHAIWQSWGWIICIKGADEHIIDVQAVPAGGTFTATLTCGLSRCVVPRAELRAGVSYTVRGTIFLWHQGTPDQFLQAYYHPKQPGVLWGSNLAVELPFTFQ